MSAATIGSLLREAEQQLSASPTPRLDAEVLLCKVLKLQRSHLFSAAYECVHAQARACYEHVIAERARGMPVAYLTGYREFWSLPVEVNPHTLIPRPETEHLVEVALELIQSQGARKLADLGTGAGAIALAIASAYPECQITATDISAEALHVARRNAARLRLHTIAFRHGDWYEALEETAFDLILANPPYIPLAHPCLKEGDLRFEPRLALLGGMDGLEALRRIVVGASKYLRLGGWLALEHGHDQKKALCELLSAAGFQGIRSLRDYGGHDRVILAQFGRS